MNFKKYTIISAAALALSLTLTGCGSGSTPNENQPGSSETIEISELTLVNGWAKAGDHMTGVFGTLTNPSDEDITLVEASSDAAGVVEMHETVVVNGSSQMSELPGGFVIPAGGTYELEPGGDHVMLMDLRRELLPGEELPITLFFSNGTEVELTLSIRDFAGAVEEYAPGDHDEHAHEMDSHDEHGDEHDE